MSAAPSSATSVSPPVPHRIILVLAIAAFASACAFRICDPLLPQLSLEYGTSTGEAAGVVTIFAVAYGVFQFLFGPLGDRYGKYRTVTAAAFLCAVGSLGAALAPSLNGMLLARFLSGAAGAGIIPLAMAWIGDNVDYAQRQATLARFITGTIVGMAAGQLIGGLFADTIGWRAAFATLAAIYLAAGLLLLRLAPARASAAQSVAVGFVGPIRSVLAYPWARVILLTVFLEGALVFGVLAFVPTYVQQRFQLGPTASGAIGGLFAVGGIGYVLVSRKLIARLGEAGLVTSGGVVLMLACALYALGPAWMWCAVGSLLSGFGYYLIHSTLQTNATQMAPARRGTAVALFACCLFLGQSAGVATAAALVQRMDPYWLFGGAAMVLPVLGAGFARALKRRAPGAA
ncbi:MFS transporter [Achromobacter aloeverae]|uniref:MFS transporter n=1 Tax=Achromobacter aloeverae TaxID=1750518 RepID=A0A4Q1HPU3_9BURK|nr:MFS transporter [Achromobacter aloeverae]RXN92396.1 MFS transporter [Achromobacter aloeverae]